MADQSSSSVAEIISAESVHQASEVPKAPATKVDMSSSTAYQKFFQTKHNSKIVSYELMSDKSLLMKNEFEINESQDQAPTFLQRIISLPNNKIFMVGGASDVECTNTHKDVYEFVKDEATGKRSKVKRANMWQSRAAFGIAVYPNFSQIFVAGGTINQ